MPRMKGFLARHVGSLCALTEMANRERKNPGLPGGQRAVRFRFQPAFQRRGMDDGKPVSALRRPFHALLLCHASVADVVDAAR